MPNRQGSGITIPQNNSLPQLMPRFPTFLGPSLIQPIPGAIANTAAPSAASIASLIAPCLQREFFVEWRMNCCICGSELNSLQDWQTHFASQHVGISPVSGH
ncbi:unnamed protein product [Protopolystoma xenopodis]|uniref:C2H2-type domain-containing protein n=1 Tax=Protopolystoma xenopodis TaxID=117903 RepID=A0A448WY76_9PLAT|nr:unnamed protein product [Protopolystoma xenopodis]